MKLRRLISALCLTAALAMGASPAARADGPLTGKTVHILIFSTGGPLEFITRSLATKLGPIIGANIIVDPRVGANGVIAANAMLAADPDGTTLMMSSSGLFTIQPSLMKLPFDPGKDIVPIGNVGTDVSAIAVDPALPVKNLKEFVAYVKASKTPISFGTAGVGNITQIWVDELNAAAGTSIRTVPYKGTAAAVLDVLGHRLAGTIGGMPALDGLAKQGKLRILGIVGDSRWTVDPSIPTIAEAGYPGVTTLSWYGLFASAKTPPAMVAYLNKAMFQAMADPALQKLLNDQGMRPTPSSSADLATRIEKTRTRLAKIIKDTNTTVDQ